MKKQHSKYKKTIAVNYKCIYCSVETNFSIPSYIAHLDMVHTEINSEDQAEVIKDLSNQILLHNKKQQKLIKKKTAKQLHKIERDKKNNELNVFREKVLSILEQFDINEKVITTINSRKNLIKLKKYLNSQLNQECKNKLLEVGINIKVPPKKKNPKKKMNRIVENVRTSVRLIYTPMGNKR